MKSLLSLLFLLFTMATGFSQNPFFEFNPNRELYAKHRIREVETHFPSGRITVKQLNTRGEIIAVIRMENGDTLSQCSIEYDSLRNVSRKLLDTADRSVDHRYYRDAQGWITGAYITDGKSEEYLSYQFDGLKHVLSEYQGDMLTASGTYDRSDRILRYEEFNDRGGQDFVVLFTRNPKGQIISKTTFDLKNRTSKRPGGVLEKITLNASGQPMESENTKTGSRTQFSYNERGLQERIEEVENDTLTTTFKYHHFAE